MEPDSGYLEARRLLKERYGQGYKIATALVDRLTNGPPIKHEDCNALQKFSVLLTSCNNTLQEIGYLNKIENERKSSEVCDTSTQTSHISFDSQCALIGAGHPATASPIVPVKVKSRGSNRTALTYALLDGGSNTTFGTHKLVQSLGIDGERTQHSLNTPESHNCVTDCALFSLEVFDLEENNFVELLSVFSVPGLPVSKKSISRREDVTRFPYLRDIQIPTINTEVGLLIENDVPKDLEPREVRMSQDQGPFAIKTVFGWMINGPLGRFGASQPSVNFI